MTRLSQRGPVLISLVTLALLLAHPSAQAQSPESTNRSSDVPVVVELFTSEGCSSCPPADLLLQKLDTGQPIPGAQLIVLSEHVTYWDHDGWKDPNSAAIFTDRQSSYERKLGEADSFTPQLIVDGTQQFKLGDPHQIAAVLQKAKEDARIPVRIGEVTLDAGNPSVLRVRVETDINSEKHNADVYLAIALSHVESQVLRGENGGKHLVHVAVVQELTKIGKLPSGKSFAQDVQLKLKAGTDPKNLRVVAFVQEPGPGKLLGAAQSKLPN
jgi:hypothetical protein